MPQEHKDEKTKKRQKEPKGKAMWLLRLQSYAASADLAQAASSSFI